MFAGILVGIAFVALTSAKFRPYLRKNPAVAFLLGISSGFPLTLLVATLTFWL
ncbi:MAG: MFS transporter, partial [Sphingomonadaceae bacterium]|nr:MFS transporter [Sphingomonadaceae bacterium]